MSRKVFPLPKRVVRITSDSESFRDVDYTTETEIPVLPHVGAFACRRKYHTHEGVDLYCPEGTPVYAIEDGVVVAIEDFTGPKAGSPWWNDTRAVMVEGESGVINYGEILEAPGIVVGKAVKAGDLIGFVKTVLRKDKGRPMSMLHLELYAHGIRQSFAWEPPDRPKPDWLLDPTPLLIAVKDNPPR